VTTQGEVKSRPALWRGLAWVTGYDGFFYGVETGSGNVKARIRTDSSLFSSPAIEDGVAYFGALDGRFLAVRLGPAAS